MPISGLPTMSSEPVLWGIFFSMSFVYHLLQFPLALCFHPTPVQIRSHVWLPGDTSSLRICKRRFLYYSCLLSPQSSTSLNLTGHQFPTLQSLDIFSAISTCSLAHIKLSHSVTGTCVSENVSLFMRGGNCEPAVRHMYCGEGPRKFARCISHFWPFLFQPSIVVCWPLPYPFPKYHVGRGSQGMQKRVEIILSVRAKSLPLILNVQRFVFLFVFNRSTIKQSFCHVIRGASYQVINTGAELASSFKATAGLCATQGLPIMPTMGVWAQ